jgi:hypothetical protein
MIPEQSSDQFLNEMQVTGTGKDVPGQRGCYSLAR